MKKIYLDYAATTPTDPKVIKAIAGVSSKIYGNAGSLHSEGRKAKEALLQARKDVAKI